MATDKEVLNGPRLRALDAKWVKQDGHTRLVLRDPLGLAPGEASIPEALAPLLALCDGSRDVPALRSALALRTGLMLPISHIQELLELLSRSLLLQDHRFEEAFEAALRAYRGAPFRSPTLAHAGYPGDPEELGKYLSGLDPGEDTLERTASDTIVGLVSPHIDYQRGGPVYAGVWNLGAESLRQAELVIILGTDHSGGPGRVTATRQCYATPWGVLPLAREALQVLEDALGPEQAYAEELHHAREHSIELAAVWLHYILGDRPCPVLPVLCGSLGPYLEGEVDVVDANVAHAVESLRPFLEQRRTVVVAAADLAHVGPSFGDTMPLDVAGRARLAAADHHLLDAINRGDAGGFIEAVRRERDRWRVCGSTPIYMVLSLLDGSQGQVTGYAQCPADPQGGSLVSIAGVLLHRAS